jgi:hypothetical protein
MVNDAERTAVMDMATAYLTVIGELESGRTWKDEENLKDAASTIIISYYKEVRPKLNYHTGASHPATNTDFKTADKIDEPQGNKKGFNQTTKTWDSCEKCGGVPKQGTNKKTNEPFVYCDTCKIYLNKDGSTYPIPQRK